jgi:uncharacterized protein (DUF2235 family)
LRVVDDMGKNIVILCDGTGNSYQNTETNVLRLYNLVLKDPERQIACYNPGVGTFPHPLVTPQRRVRRILELTLGLGLMDDVAKLYKILMRQYEPEDTIFLFGFSRGAFTVRALAALIHVCGLLKAEDVHLLPHAVELFRTSEARIAETKKKQGVDPKLAQHDNSVFDCLTRQFKLTFARECQIGFMGLWDTVKAYGFFLPKSFPCLRHNPSVLAVRHAVALNEQRSHFQMTGWGDRDDRSGRVKEVWFYGDHCDVGGGHDNGNNVLADITLAWMIGEATNHGRGLLLDENKESDIEDLMARARLGCVPRPRNLDESIQWWISRCPRPELDNTGYPPTRPWRFPPSARREPIRHIEGGRLRYHDSVPQSVTRPDRAAEEATVAVKWTRPATNTAFAGGND